MKRIYQIFFTIVAIAATMIGCAKSDIEGVSVAPSGEETGTFRVVATTANDSDDTKVNIDGITVTWSEDDVITLAEVDGSGNFVTYSRYKIDKTTISEDGKSAEFYGADLVEGKKYVAYSYGGSGSLSSSATSGISNGFECAYNYESYESESVDLIMQSQSFEYDGADVPEVYFEHKSALLELTITLDPASQYSGTVNSMEISSSGGDNIFLSTVVFNGKGEIINSEGGKYGSQSSIAVNTGFDLNSSTTTVVKIPVTWNSEITEPVGDFEFVVKTTDFATSTVAKTLKVLENGVRYSSTLTFDEPIADQITANEIWYTTTDGKVIDLNSDQDPGVGFDATVVSNSYENGRGVLLFNAPVTTINQFTFADKSNLKSIMLPEGVVSIGESTFAMNTKLEYVNFPKSLTTIGNYLFKYTSSVKRFEGDCELISDDGYTLTRTLSGTIEAVAAFANGAGLTSYTIADGMTWIDNYCFYNATELTELHFPSTLNFVESTAFEGTPIERIYGDYVSEDNRSWVVDNTLIYAATDGITSYTTPDGITTLADGAFSNRENLEKITISDDVTNVLGYGYLFSNSTNLKEVTISARMGRLGYDPFGFSYNNIEALESVYLRAPIPPSVSHNAPDIVATCFPNLTIYVPKETLDLYLTSSDWQPYVNYIEGYDYGDLSGFYEDVDYSKDGEVVTLQEATVGDGIDLVIVGDGFNDTTMESGGVYETRMKEAMEHYFTEEPNKSFRDRYNVYAVKAVSAGDCVDGINNTTFGVQFGIGTIVSGNDTKVFEYALKVPEIESTDDLLVIIVVNSDRYAGTCYMYDNGAAATYCPIISNDDEQFRQVLVHETGHGFSKLLDEYCYEGTITLDAINDFYVQKAKGWGANVDVISDRDKIQWAHFLSDSRYDGQVDVYEGALTYEYGAYRPTDVSIMRFNTGGFNAPSREAIYKRIMELSGETYSYEEFVEYDAINRATSSQLYSVSQTRSVNQITFVPFAKPVLVGSSPSVTK